jgi:hypothetical protein
MSRITQQDYLLVNEDPFAKPGGVAKTMMEN